MPTPPTGTISPPPGIKPSSAKVEALRLDALSFAYGSKPAVDGVDLTIESGTFFALLGPSGCGKTTLLRLLGGYLRAAAGVIVLDGRDVTAAPPERRDVGMVFQNFALFTHLSARANVSFGLEMRGVARAERTRRVEAMLDRVDLSSAERGRYPRELSGGQQQRVALARALVIEPRLLLLDEPLANLDRHLRDQLREELRVLQRRSGVTTLLVTHDQEEALGLADRVGVMAAGRLLQEDTPEGLYLRPRTPFVARFLGDANLLTIAAVEGDSMRLSDGLTLPRPQGTVGPGTCVLIRPERVAVGPEASACPATWQGRITGRTFLGPDQILTVLVSATTSLRVRCRATEWTAPVGTTLSVGLPADAIWAISEADPPGVPAPPLPRESS